MVGTRVLVLMLLLGLAACTKPEPADPLTDIVSGDQTAAPLPSVAEVAKAEEIGPGDIMGARKDCRVCRQFNCTDMEGTGFDLVKACFANSDRGFTQDCIEAKNCMIRNHCGHGPNGSAECYCGKTDLEECVLGKAPPTGPCVEVFTKAGREPDFHKFMANYDYVGTPMGTAHALRYCEVSFCPACIEDAPQAAPKP